jgi:hypothetical protein
MAGRRQLPVETRHYLHRVTGTPSELWARGQGSSTVLLPRLNKCSELVSSASRRGIYETSPGQSAESAHGFSIKASVLRRSGALAISHLRDVTRGAEAAHGQKPPSGLGSLPMQPHSWGAEPDSKEVRHASSAAKHVMWEQHRNNGSSRAKASSSLSATGRAVIEAPPCGGPSHLAISGSERILK